MDVIHELERAIGKNAQYELLPMQPGDLSDTHADVSTLIKDFDFKPATPYKLGVRKLVEWHKRYYLSC